METATTADSVAGGDWMPLAEAAVFEGVKSLAIRRRIEAGTMVGERRRTAHGWRWFVRVHAVQSSVKDQLETAPRSLDDVSAKVGDMVATDAPSWSDVVALYEARIADLRLENDRLRVEHLEAFTRLEAAHLDAFTRLETVHGETLQVLMTTHSGEVDAFRRELATANAWANRSWWRWLFGLPPA